MSPLPKARIGGPPLIDHAVMRLSASFPRGGYRLAMAARQMVPGLKDYPATIKFGSLVLRGDIADNVFYPLAIAGYYKHQAIEDDVLVRMVRGARLIADVGGNIGFTAALMAHFAPQAHIVVFEPLPVCRRYLAQVAAHFSNVTIMAKAVSRTAGTAQFAIREQIDESSLLLGGASHLTQTQVAVEVTTLDAEFAGRTLDVIKIDVEGSEPDVLAGGRTVISQSQPVVLFEAFNPDIRSRCFAFFRGLNLGYALFAVSRHKRLRPLIGDDSAEGDTNNFVAWPASRAIPADTEIVPSYAR